MPGRVNSIKMKVEWWLPETGGRREWRVSVPWVQSFRGTEFVCDNENVLKVDCGDGCTLM